MENKELNDLVVKISKLLRKSNMLLATAESCTAGLLSAAITQVPGASHYFDRGFVTYSNVAKEEMLDVDVASLDLYGVISEEVALEMTKGALKNSQCDVAVAITGIAGPGGGTPEIPVGTVCFAWAMLIDSKEAPLFTQSSKQQFTGDREQIRNQAVQFALSELLEILVSCA